MIRAWIPSRLLKPGVNRIVIVARDSSRERDDSRPYGFPWPGSSGVVYDAVQFRHEPNMELTQPEVNVLPFYRNSAGGLMQEFDVRIPIRPGDSSLQVSLEVGGQIWREKRTLEHTFGEALFLGRVAEFKQGSPATLTVEREGRGSETWRFALNPARKWKLLVMPNAHLDVGYTDYAAKVSEVQARSIDRLIEITRQRPEFRFTLDGFWIVEEFLHGRRPESVEAFIKLARSGNIAIPACYGSTFTGFASLENLVRSIYPSARFAREHGLPLTFSLNTDVPSYSWSYASVLASAGVSNFLAASDAYRGPLLLYNQLNERSPTWWEGPDGGRVLTWWSRHYHQAGSLFSFPLNLTAGRESLPRFLQAYDHPHRTTDVALIYGTQVENVDIHAGQADLVGLWNREYAYPELQYGGFGEAMEMMRRLEPDPSKFPVTRGDTGPYWEDGLGANAKATSGHRSNMVRILSAEVLGAAALSTGSGFKPDIRTLEAAWQRLLLTDEHSWHADCSVREPHSHQSLRQGDEKDARVQEASRMIDALLSRSMSALSDSISVPAGTLVVFNTLSWDRDGWVEHDINRGSRVVDLSTGKPVPMEAIGEGRQIQRVRFLAAGVPAAGYRCYAIRPGPAPVRAPEPLVGNMAESPFYRLIIDPATGNIRSLYDKQAERELIATNSGHSFAQALYVSGGDSLPNRLVQFSSVTPVPELQMHRPVAISPAILLKSELGVELRGAFRWRKSPGTRCESDCLIMPGVSKLSITSRRNRLFRRRRFTWPSLCPWILLVFGGPHKTDGLTRSGI
ncbi:MAG: hypothetical protein FJ405_02500 [Verrucomicrobia bacterium]|nr:hypothetical protein [Verrucomicrobiota bacterium]